MSPRSHRPPASTWARSCGSEIEKIAVRSADVGLLAAVLDRPQHRHEIGNFLRVVDERALGEADIDPGEGERPNERRHTGAGRHEHRDVAVGNGSRTSLVDDGGPGVDECPQRLDDRRRLFGAALTDGPLGVAMSDPPDARAGIILPEGAETDRRRVRSFDELGEDLRDRSADFGGGAEVRRQFDRGIDPHGVTHRAVARDVGAPEAVDRLHRVAHEEEAAARERTGAALPAEEREHLKLERVGVLELVDEEVPVPRPSVFAHRGGRGEDLVAEDEEVGEEEAPDRASLVREACRFLTQSPANLAEHAVPDRREAGGACLVVLPQRLPCVLDPPRCPRGRPTDLPPRLARERDEPRERTQPGILIGSVE